MENNGYRRYAKKIKNYINPVYIGITTGELISIEPVTIRVTYGREAFDFDEFLSLISFERVRREDIGTRYIVQLAANNSSLYVLGEINNYKEYYPEE